MHVDANADFVFDTLGTSPFLILVQLESTLGMVPVLQLEVTMCLQFCILHIAFYAHNHCKHSDMRVITQ